MALATASEGKGGGVLGRHLGGVADEGMSQGTCWEASGRLEEKQRSWMRGWASSPAIHPLMPNGVLSQGLCYK